MVPRIMILRYLNLHYVKILAYQFDILYSSGTRDDETNVNVKGWEMSPSNNQHHIKDACA